MFLSLNVISPILLLQLNKNQEEERLRGNSIHSFVYINDCFLQTTELCAKQDAYYREVISELESQLKETVAGRDHVLALRYVCTRESN